MLPSWAFLQYKLCLHHTRASIFVQLAISTIMLSQTHITLYILSFISANSSFTGQFWTYYFQNQNSIFSNTDLHQTAPLGGDILPKTNVVTSTILRRRPGMKLKGSVGTALQTTGNWGSWCPYPTMPPMLSSADSPVTSPGLVLGRTWANGCGVMALHGAMNHGP